MIIETLTVGMFQENCYLLVDEDSREAAIVDPGDEPERILQAAKHHNASVKYLLHTHAHLDHVGATKALKATLGAPILLHRAEEQLYNGLRLQGEMFGFPMDDPAPVDYLFDDDETFTLGKTTLQTRLTPGHSPGGCCFLIEGEDVMLNGDTVMQGGIGRTDLPGGSMEVLLRSIRTQILSLPNETKLLPGHGPATTVGFEREHNPFLKGLS